MKNKRDGGIEMMPSHAILRILYIEDSKEDQIILERSLKKRLHMDFSLSSASSGVEGLRLIENSDFDLIFLDYKLPGMSGLELLRELQKKSDIPPVIFVTSQGSEMIAVTAMKLGAKDYLVKQDLETDRIAEAVQDTLADSILPPDIDADIAWEILKLFKESPSIKASIHNSIVTDPELKIQYDDVVPLLDRLESIGAVEKTPLSTTLSCPTCGAMNASLVLECPVCTDTIITKGKAIEHLTCGHVDFHSSFEHTDGTLRCPKCNKTLKGIGIDYQKVGHWYKCSKDHLSHLPLMKYQCPDCGELTALDEMDLKNLHSYSLNSSGHRMIHLGILTSVS